MYVRFIDLRIRHVFFETKQSAYHQYVENSVWDTRWEISPSLNEWHRLYEQGLLM